MKKIIISLILLFTIIELHAQSTGGVVYRALPPNPDNTDRDRQRLKDFNDQEAAKWEAARLKVEKDDETAGLKREKEMITKMNSAIEIYNSFKKYPAEIQWGWHNVYATNKSDFCLIAKAFVDGNKIKRFTYDTVENSVEIISSFSIKNGIGVVNYKDKNSVERIVYVLFLEDIDEFQK